MKNSGYALAVKLHKNITIAKNYLQFVELCHLEDVEPELLIAFWFMYNMAWQDGRKSAIDSIKTKLQGILED